MTGHGASHLPKGNPNLVISRFRLQLNFKVDFVSAWVILHTQAVCGCRSSTSRPRALWRQSAAACHLEYSRHVLCKYCNQRDSNWPKFSGRFICQSFLSQQELWFYTTLASRVLTALARMQPARRARTIIKLPFPVQSHLKVQKHLRWRPLRTLRRYLRVIWTIPVSKAMKES